MEWQNGLIEKFAASRAYPFCITDTKCVDAFTIYVLKLEFIFFVWIFCLCDIKNVGISSVYTKCFFLNMNYTIWYFVFGSLLSQLLN